MTIDLGDINKIYSHPDQPQMQAEVILASRHADLPGENPLYTIRMRYPRPIHGEIMTHRDFSRNARSSRAVPVKTMLNEVRTMPYVPWHWGKNQKGMQADEECNELLFLHDTADHWENREDAWLHARDAAANIAEAYMKAGYHKQIPNRLLEPFSWIDTLITATEWDNFLWLRDHKDAEPHLQDLARLVKQAIEAAKIQELKPGEWHLPYVTYDDYEAAHDQFFLTTSMKEWNEWLCKISAARCARISYKPFDGDASYEAELRRYDQLVTADRVHASPLEHQATPDTQIDRWLTVGSNNDQELITCWENPELHGNLVGYVQARKLVPNECYRGASNG